MSDISFADTRPDEPRGQIETALLSLDESTRVLVDCLGQLEKRLNPVLRENEIEEKSLPASIEEIRVRLVPLAETVSIQHSVVRSAIRNVNNILERLEL